jgi:CDP-6-deoxy-D-xylo-4-hexulose-3-dehydrase
MNVDPRPRPFHYPLAISTWGAEERAAAIAVIESGQTTMGAKVSAFEARFAEMFGARHAVMVNSGSSANLLAVAALFHAARPLARPGSVAIVPAVSWATTYYPLCQYGLTLRFVDIDRETLNFDLAALARAIDADVSVIFAVNLLGNPNDYDAIARLLADRDITLIEDNCESMGAVFGGRFAGRFGRIGTFSSFFSHHISTMEGGVCLTDDDDLHQVLVSLRAHGWIRGLPAGSRLAGDAAGDPFQDAFRFVLPGYNLRPLEVSGAIGVEQLKRLPHLVARRRAMATRLQAALSGLRGLRLQREVGQSSWFGFAMTLTETNVPRELVVARLAAAGVETRPVVAGNFTRQPVLRHLPHEVPPPLPNADHVHDHGFYIGNNDLDDAGVDHLARVIRDAVS